MGGVATHAREAIRPVTQYNCPWCDNEPTTRLPYRPPFKWWHHRLFVAHIEREHEHKADQLRFAYPESVFEFLDAQPEREHARTFLSKYT